MRIRNRLYYFIRPLIPRSFQVGLRRSMVRMKRKKYADVWPISPTAGAPPKGWGGWPRNKRFALVLQHDVEAEGGLANIPPLVSLEKSLGFRSSFGFVPEKYAVPVALRHELRSSGFEIVVHGLNHDGKLFLNKQTFMSRAVRINVYLRDWECEGFSTPSAHHKPEWMNALNIAYATSTFDTDPFEPEPDGIDTIFPVWMAGGPDKDGYLELPYTMPQDFTLYILMKEQTIDIWKRKADWIAEKGGMILLKTHPDYMDFEGDEPNTEKYPSEKYREFLTYIKTAYPDQYWNATEKEVVRFWRSLPRTYSVRTSERGTENSQPEGTGILDES